MRKLASLLIVIVILSAGTAGAATVLRVQAWNLFQCRGTDNICNVPRQAATMVQSDPDIILTSEIIEGDIPLYISELNRLTGETWHSHFVPICNRATCDGAAGQGQAIFSNIAPSGTSEVYFSGQDRSALAMIFNIEGRTIAVVSTHLAANNWDIQNGQRWPDNSNLRNISMTEMKNWAATLASVQIIGGDFNFNPTMTYQGATELSTMTSAGYIESWQKALEANAAFSYPDNPPSMSTWTRRSRIDYIFYKGAGLDATSSRIRDLRDLGNPNVVITVGNADDNGVRPSDHNMVETVITVTPAGGGDTTNPTVAITEPSGGITVSGTTNVSATATDNVAVAGVQFKLDNQPLGAEDTVAPYSVPWNTTSTSNGSHVLAAVARDAAGNTATSTVTVTVDNPVTSGLVGHWKFDEGSGFQTADSSGGGATGDLINSPAWTTPGILGSALTFNGTNRVSIPNQAPWNTPSSKYTVAFWVKINDIRNYAGVVAVGNWGTRMLEIMTANNQWNARINTSGTWGCDVVSTTPLNYLQSVDGNFHHVAVVLDTTISRCFLYSDGQLVGVDEYVNGMTSFGTPSLNIGGFADANRLPSVVDDVRFYNTALTEAQVQALANADTTNPTVTITAPSGGTTVSGTTNVSATATDNVAVAGVQFKLDGQPLGAEDTIAPYSVSWNTTSTSNGSHVLAAVARDAAGNTATSTVTVTVDNPATSGLVGHWKFDEGSGFQTADSSGGGATGDLINSPAWTTPGILGSALTFNGTNRVSIPNQAPWNTPSSKYTVAFWVKVNDIRNYAGVVAVGNWGTRMLEIMTTSNQWNARINTNGTWGCDVFSTTPLGYLQSVDGNFHHVAVVLDTTISRCFLYSDGQLVGTDEYVNGMTSFGTPSLNFGGFADANRLPSVVDDVRFYNTALTAAQVQALATPP